MPYHSMQPRGPPPTQCYIGNRVYYNPPAASPSQHVRHPQEMGSPPRIIMQQQQPQHPMSSQQVVFQPSGQQQVTYVATPSGQQQIVTMQGQQMRVMAPPGGQFSLPPGAIVMRQQIPQHGQMNPSGSYPQQTLIQQVMPQQRLVSIPSQQQPQQVMVGHQNAHQQQPVTYVQQQPQHQQQQTHVQTSVSRVYSAAASSVQPQQAQSTSATTSVAYDVPTDSNKLLDKRTLEELVKEVDTCEQLDEDVKDVLLQVTDDFVERIIADSCRLAKHRKSTSLEVKDVKLVLEKNWNMYIPGFGSEEPRPMKKGGATEAHKQRMAMIKKSLKKT